MKPAGTVSVASSQVSTLNRVEPGDTDNSYLWLKLMGTYGDVGGTGATMPKTGALTPEELDTIEAWILGGALP